MHRKPEGFICDIDGTVADSTDVRGIHEYHKVRLDKPKPATIIIVRALINEGLEPIFASGRPDANNNQVRSDTVWWIREYITTVPFNLYMRPEFLEGQPGKRDFRKDYVVKEEIYTRYIEPKWDVKLALEDRLQVAQLWYRLGIPLFRTGDPDAVF